MADVAGAFLIVAACALFAGLLVLMYRSRPSEKDALGFLGFLTILGIMSAASKKETPEERGRRLGRAIGDVQIDFEGSRRTLRSVLEDEDAIQRWLERNVLPRSRPAGAYRSESQEGEELSPSAGDAGFAGLVDSRVASDRANALPKHERQPDRPPSGQRERDTERRRDRSNTVAQEIAVELGFEWTGSPLEIVMHVVHPGVDIAMTPATFFGFMGDWENWPSILTDAKERLDAVESRIRNDADLLSEHRHRLHEMLWKRRQEWYRHRENAWSAQRHDGDQIVSEAFRAVDQVGRGTRVREARECLIQSQRLVGNLYLRRDDRDELRKKLQSLWHDLDLKAGVHRESLDHQRRDWEQRQREWVAKLEDDLKRLAERRERVAQNVEGNRGRLSSARTSEFARTVEEWIEEGETQIAALDASLADIEEHLREGYRRLEK